MSNVLDRCSMHQQVGIAVQCLVKDQYHYSILCENCLAERVSNNQIYLLKDAQSVFEEFRLQCLSEFELEQNDKISFYRNLQLIVQKLQNHFLETFDQINNQINEKLEFITQIFNQGYLSGNQEIQILNPTITEFGEQLLEEITKFENIKNIGQQNAIDFQNQIQYQILKLQQSQILNECLELLISVDEGNQIILKEQNGKNLEYQKKSVQRTPKLDLMCKEHEKEIIIFDLSEQQSREKRARCVECDPCIFTSLSKCQNIWKNYERQQSEILEQFYLSRKSQIGSIKQQLLQLRSCFTQKINEIIQQLNGIMAQSEQEVFTRINSMNKDWNTMTMDEVLDIAETLSKQEMMTILVKEMEIKYKMKNLDIDSIFQNSIEGLQEIYNQITLLKLCLIQEEPEVRNDGSPQKNDCRKQSSNSAQSENHSVELSISNSDQKIKQIQNKIKSLEEWRIQQLKWSDKFIDYQLFYTKKQAEWCNAIAFNKEGNIMIAGCIFSIKVFDFQKGRIVQTYQAKQHQGDVNCLLFSKILNQFISGSDDRTIRIWSQSEKNEWKCIQVLQGHQDWVLCLILTEDEQILFSGSRDKTIKKWTKNQDNQTYQCTQTLDLHTDAVLGLSLNKSESFLVSSSYDKSIIVWYIKETFLVEKKQIIQKDSYGNRILFINETQFFWQPNNNQIVHVYKYNDQSSSFESSKHNIQQFQADDDYQYFPSKFLKAKGLFANIHNRFIYITKQINEEEFEVVQIIEFDDYRKFGAFTENGEYLVTWHYTACEFQIRKNVGSSRIQW
ncbi:unnamed protein product (macronuclear) [Paramecium tetraurelia]|uniref:Uncharacterized protein n=1 Tax=Paramecium tetraurelia TaxID=5888 RepID=A0C2C5_PARTE|nr:uncharacterized protein GSPATT00034419001 [Paramecium tetraurelia]CAK64942.1 unnamed protein product [Paramecium tetraurelia]|eukprot:XP_001432339.1 hypothetical protein (macronuclear) [Paramecium tetraurelia strain d4-2]